MLIVSGKAYLSLGRGGKERRDPEFIQQTRLRMRKQKARYNGGESIKLHFSIQVAENKSITDLIPLSFRRLPSVRFF